MKYNSSKEWSRKPTDIMKGSESSKKNLSAYRIVARLRSEGFLRKHICIYIGNAYRSWLHSSKLVYAGEVMEGLVIDNTPYIRFKRYDKYYKLELRDKESWWWYSSPTSVSNELEIETGICITEANIEDFKAFDDAESAELYAEMAED